MGNCIGSEFDDVISPYEELEYKKLKFSAKVDQKFSLRPRNFPLKGQRVKMVLSKKQLEVLMRRVKKWRPSLATIPEF
ncbi:hypothetical protein CDL12_28456 [Handroanthus impetiginosus]|uniref:Uncharacterized protein n=1 Tax=Handroanthus impetiginosus TaxID=429701 RepID=A0A2G9G159_9LAMI|nr:hypothetical protein CDL12_28456 [Handroanthus impetiginosus]